MKVLSNLAWLITYVVDKESLQSIDGFLVVQLLCECPENGKIGRTFQVEYPTRLLRLIVVFKTNLVTL